MQRKVQYQEAVDAKDRYRRELEQSQLQYREAVKQHEVQLQSCKAERDILQYELQELRGREQ